jgi:hypothetical protein
MKDEGGRMKVIAPVGEFKVECGHKHQNGEKVHLLVRPLEALSRASRGGQKEVNVIEGRVADVLFQKDGYKVTLENGLYFHLKDAPKVGSKISVRVSVECLP